MTRTKSILFTSIIVLLCLNMMLNSKMSQIMTKISNGQNINSLAFLQNLSKDDNKAFNLNCYLDNWFDYSTLEGLFRENDYEEVSFLNCSFFNAMQNDIFVIQYISDALKTLSNLKLLRINLEHDREFDLIGEVLMNKTSLIYLDLNVSGFFYPTEIFIESLNTLTNIETLIFSSNFGNQYFRERTFFDIFTPISKMNNLKVLDLSALIFKRNDEPMADLLADALRNKTKLQYLDLSYSYLSNELSRTISKLTDLNFLKLPNNSINDNEINEMGDALKKLTKLKYLSVRTMYGESPEFVKFGEAIANMPDLEELYIETSRFVEVAQIEIAKSLQFCTKLRSLRLLQCYFSEKATETLDESFKNMQHLEYLHLESNDLSSAGAKSIANGLSDKIQLRKLAIINTKLATVHGKGFGTALYNKPNLIELTLTNFDLDNNASIELFDYLSNAPKLDDLDFQYVSISDESVNALGKSLSKMKQLRLILLDSNQITRFGPQIILDSLKSNFQVASLILEDNIVNAKDDSLMFLESDVIINNGLKQRISHEYSEIDHQYIDKKLLHFW